MRQILVYADLGVAPSCLEHTITSLQNEITNYCIRKCSAQELLCSDWEEMTDLLVIPGGRDLPYHQKLFPLATRRISQYVAGGGKYWGICAGGYFGAREIVFEQGSPLEIFGFRDLGFFPGKAIGPVFGTGLFRYESDEGLEAASLEWKSDDLEITCHTYYNGGCYFEALTEDANVRVLGRYADIPGQPAAIVDCRFGRGRAVLSGVHLEISVHNWVNSSVKMQKVQPLLLSSHEARLRCLRSLINVILSKEI